MFVVNGGETLLINLRMEGASRLQHQEEKSIAEKGLKSKKIPVRTKSLFGPMRTFCHFVLQLTLLLLLCTYARGQPPGIEGAARFADERVNFTIYEGQPPGTLVGMIPVKSGFTYKFNEPPSEFSLDPRTGALTTSVALDREALKKRINLLVLSSHPVYPIEVYITVLDINDNDPVFPQRSITISIAEIAEVGATNVLDVAVDKDLGDNGTVGAYKIVSGNEDGKFAIVMSNHLGSPLLLLELKQKLDHEVKNSYNLNISARDKGKPPRFGFLQIHISVSDVNDNSPKFELSFYSARINESVPVGTSVIQVIATDDDTGIKSDIIYSIDDEKQFTIDSLTGVIKTKERLQCPKSCKDGLGTCKEYEKNSTCVVNVQAKDVPRTGNSTPLIGRTRVGVTLIDENDHSPVIKFGFLKNLDYATVDESAHKNDVVAFITVTDSDVGMNALTELSLTAGNELGHFGLRNYTMAHYTVLVAGKLDREKINKYNLTIVAKDRGTPQRSSTAFLKISVNDVNDHAPEFQQKNYHADLSELVQIGSFVAGITATDNDTSDETLLQYDIVSGNNLGWFTINKKTGLVTTAKLLNADQISLVTLNISAMDGGSRPHISFTKLTINVHDENNQVPTFGQTTYSIIKTEGLPAGTEIITAKAIDNDKGINGTVSYTLLPEVTSSYPDTFILNSKTGLLTTKITLDREVVPFYVIKIKAQDNGNPALSSTATVFLNVTDINDNPPIFYPLKYYTTVYENQPVGTKVRQVKATDLDEGDNGRVIYSIVSGAEGKFMISSSSGWIRTLAVLNRQQKSKYTLQISAQDPGGLIAPTRATVDVTVIDRQAVPPVFSQPAGYTFQVFEDSDDETPAIGLRVGKVTASSTNTGTSISYAISSGDPLQIFKIDANGYINTNKKVDREKHPNFSLKVVAKVGDLFAETTVNITVKDKNDNAPVFGSVSVDAVVIENWPVGHEVYHAHASDKDEGPNALVKYTLIQDPDAAFGINPDTGIIFLQKPMILEVKKFFQLQVRAVDSGTPQKSTTMQVKLIVQDVNDHTPTFTQETYEIAISESLEVNSRFYTVSARDADNGPNGEVIYTIIKGNVDNKFGIFPDGVIYVAHALDRETRDMYKVVLKAIDKAPQPRSSTSSIIIQVLDANDNKPVFSNKSYTMSLPENSPIGTSVGIVSASDHDIGRNQEIVYMLENGMNDFKINPSTGKISSETIFDREELLRVKGQDFVEFSVIAMDHGIVRQRDQAIVKVMISDRNDNVPVFVKLLYEATLYENAALETPVLKVNADDLDSGLNGFIFYTITKGNEDSKFHINQGSGQIKLVRKLDRETKDSYELTVTAQDQAPVGPLSSTTVVRIKVLDYNDNTPVFGPSQLSADLLETTNPGELITTFSATDQDFGSNAVVSYGISTGNQVSTFNLDSNTGKLYLAKKVDYEATPKFHLNITATDHGNPRLSSTISFTVNVLDYNDNSPVFPTDPIGRQIREGIAANTSIVQVTATDADSGDNGKVRYSLIQENPVGHHFRIDPVTGWILTNAKIDREQEDNFVLKVVAVDQAMPKKLRRSAEKMVNIIVMDLNDNAPKFVSMEACMMPRNSVSGSKVTTIQAIDADTGKNGNVTYELKGGDLNMFTLKSVTGDLYLRSNLPSSALTYELSIAAEDQGMSDPLGRKIADSKLTVIVPGDSGPTFSQSQYNAKITENSPISTPVVTVSASGGSGSTIRYYVTSITSGGINQPRYFKVNTESGVVSTAEILDRETGFENFIVEIVAIDRSATRPKTNSVRVHISLLDQNDSPPLFSPSNYHVSVPENSSGGRTVAIISARDADKDQTITFRMLSGNDGKFTLNSRTGVLTTTGGLDREKVATYNLVVEASDGVHRSTAAVTVNVKDINDNAPKFSASSYSFDVAENMPKGTTVSAVTASDPDAAGNGSITFTYATAYGQKFFALDPKTGIITVNGSLNYEQTPHYILKIKAADGGSPSLSSTVTVFMNILDQNDNVPVFDPVTYSVAIFENATIGNSIVTVRATDQDSGVNGKIKYSIESGDNKHQFRIDSDNGAVHTTKALDREDQAYYTLVVKATDQAKDKRDRLSSTTQVTIILKDINDCAPEFKSPNETEVMENTPLNTVVYTVVAEDKDAERNKYVTYKLISVPFNAFSLEPLSGKLKVNGNLDRERIPSYKLKIQAVDQGKPPQSSTMELLVKIRDENDNDPQFVQTDLYTKVSEDAVIGKSLLKLTATDKDQGLNSMVRYFIIAGNPNQDFKADEYTGILRVNKKLDYERINQYKLIVRAEDSGSTTRYDTATVSIRILDQNDCSPAFVDAPYTAFVQENMKNLPVHVTMVTATDDDSEDNNQLTYAIRRGNQSVFQINSRTGEIKAKIPLDREAVPSYSLTIVAHDSGIPRLSGTATVRVIINDVNDHDPQFERNAYSGYIEENTKPYASITAVHATDKDEGVNAEIRYKLLDSMGDRFTVNPASGLIMTTASLDREHQDLYKLIVIASDSGSTPRSSTASVTIFVEDQNDHAPEFEHQANTGYIPDQTKSGAFVIGLTAVDQDVGPNCQIVYALSGGDSSSFSINQDNGVVTATQLLTRASKPNGYKFTVRATDKGTPSLSNTTVVDIKFLASTVSNPPNFATGQRSFKLSESKQVGSTVMTAHATSPVAANPISYDIIGGNIGQTFEIGIRNGEVKIARGLDYEITHNYNMWVRAQDSRSPAGTVLMSITVDVEDENDNPPKFDQSFYNKTIAEGLPPNQNLLTVTATDADSGVNKEIEFSIISGNTKNAFTINSASGIIKTAVSLDREVLDQYTLIVKAADKGTPQKSATATVLVKVEDINDNRPIFTKLFNVDIPENSPKGTFIIRITSSDLDIGVNAVALYSFQGKSSKFAIDSSSGNVTVIGDLDREEKDEYTLTVEANDQSHKISTTLTIFISDVNDHEPVFGNKTYSFEFKELQQAESTVGVVHATDEDGPGVNSEIVYSLKQDDPSFRIDPNSGKIKSKKSLVYIHGSDGPLPKNKHNIIVIASDRGNPSKSAECTCSITVIDANNNAPVFKKSRYVSAVPENAQIGQKVIQLVAEDKLDYGINAVVRYFQQSGNGTNFFRVDQSTGWVTVSSSLSGQKNKEFTFGITANDSGIPHQFAKTAVRLQITGINYYTPQFVTTNFVKQVKEDIEIGTILEVIQAKDDDTGLNGQVDYLITSGNELGLFEIGETNGMLKVRGTLDYDSVKVHKLGITARDRGLESRETTRTFTIYLKDVNDNPPKFNSTTYDAYIPENSALDTVVMILKAQDADSGPNAVIEYSLIGDKDAQRMFAVRSSTGELVSQVPAAQLDYETRNKYQAAILASNPNSQMQSTVMVSIHVTSVNEYMPKFLQKAYTFRVSESATVGASVGKVYASDDDSGKDGIVYYYLISESNNKGFRIDPLTGSIYVTKAPDRESQSAIILDIMAKNRGPLRGNDTDHCKVTLVVQDANDAPVFTKDNYEARVLENATSGQSITKVTAVDNDLKPEHRLFSYKIMDSDLLNTFAINARSGEVTVIGKLDRETLPIYNVTVGAVDTGSPPQTGTALLKIILDDVNDNGPFFIPTVPVGYVTEDETPPANIMVLTSLTSDPDLPRNQGPYDYIIPGSSPMAQKFKVDSGTGILSAKVRLDREAQPEYSVPILVKDGGNPRMTSTLSLRVIVRDINDSPSLPRPLNIVVFTYQSQYPVGKIADVRPVDPDTVGTYTCRKTQGSNLFSIQDACNLHAQKVNQPSNFSLKVSGSDGIHSEVSYSVNLEYRQINNDTLANTIIVQLDKMITENFLQNSYVNFMRVVSEMFSRNDKVMLYGIDKVGSVLNLLIAAKRPNGKYYYVSNMETLFKTNRARIESEAGVRLKVIGLNPCDTNPCMNSGECSSVVQIFSDTAISSSQSLVITAPSNNGGFSCTCRNGFSGHYCNVSQTNCQTNPCKNGGHCHVVPGGSNRCECTSGWEGPICDKDIDECQRDKPCRNGGACYNQPAGTYTCSCKQGYIGKNCEVKVDYCKGTVCKNGGTCHSETSTYRCECPFGNAGKNCEHTSIGFDEVSYMEFGMLKEMQNSIILEFSTVMSNALLLYNVGPKRKNPREDEFLALEIIDGKVRFSYALGDGITTRISIRKAVNDGQWYRVAATRQSQQGFLSVSDCPLGSIICNQCQDSSCQNSSSTSQSSILNVKPPLTIGGVRDLSIILNYENQVDSHDFVGCMRNITVDGKDLLATPPLASEFTTNKCPRSKKGSCASDTCGKGGKCIDRWAKPLCECPPGKMPPDCKSAITPFSFGANSRVTFKPKESFNRDAMFAKAKGGSRRKRSVPTAGDKISFSFRTLEKNSLVFYSASGKDFTVIMVSNGNLKYGSIKDDVQRFLMIPEKTLIDGTWKNVTLTLTGGSTISLDVNGELKTSTFNTPVHNFLGLDITHLSLGGSKSPVEWDGQTLKSFNGCISEFKINDKVQPFSGETERFTIEAVGGVSKSCPAATICSPNPCGDGYTCLENNGDYRCEAIPAPETLNIGIIIVIVFFIILLIAIVVSVFIIRRRRKRKDVPKINGTVIMGNKHVNESGQSNHSYQDSGYTENGEVISDAFIRNHIAEELATMKYSERSVDNPRPRPDIIDQDAVVRGRPMSPSPVHMEDGTVIIENGDTMGFEELPELYDLENASSIAPPDIDIVKHYKKYRKYSGNPHLPSHIPSHLRSSPNNFLNSSRDSPTSVSRQSPNLLADGPNLLNMQSTPLTRQSPLNIPGAQSPVHMQGYPTPVRQSPLGHLPRQSPKTIGASPLTLPNSKLNNSRTNSEQSLSRPAGRSNHSGSTQSVASRDRRARTPNRHNNGHQNRPGKLKNMKGLTVEEINRLNARPQIATPPSTIDADHSSSDGGKPPRYQDIFEPTGLLQPPESSSDDVSDDDFTCSEFEYDNHEKIRSEFDTNIMIFPKVQEEDENEEDSPSNRTFSGDESARGSLSTLLVSDEDMPKHAHPQKNLGGAFNWDYLLNWGPSFEKLVGVFQDIAELPDANSVHQPQEPVNETSHKHEEYV